MKKIFYIIASAIVALGAVACQNDIEEGIKPENKGEGVSFTAEIADLTRVAVEDSDDVNYDKKLAWEGNETIVATYDSKQWKFTNTTEDPYTFTCKAEGAEELLGKAISLAYNQDNNYEAHANGSAQTIILSGHTINLGNAPVKFNLVGGGLIFHFTCTEETVIKWYGTDDNIGYYNGGKKEHTFAAGEHYISVEGGGLNMTLEAWVDGVKIKSTSTTFDTGKIYNLGDIKKPTINEVWGIVGSYQGWANTAAEATRFYDYGDYLLARNVEGLDANFKFVKIGSWDGARGMSSEDAVEANKWTICDGGYDIKAPSAEAYDVYYLPYHGEFYLVAAGGNKPKIPATLPDFSIAGEFNSWGDEVMTETATFGLFVAKNVTIEEYTSLKIKRADSWGISFGGGINYLQSNKYMTVYGSGKDITIAEGGAFDIYFDVVNEKLYLMKSGVNYTTATLQDADGPKPATTYKFYVTANSNWQSAGTIVGYFWGDVTEWATFTKGGDGIYVAELTVAPKNMILQRKSNPTYDWNNIWDRLGNISVPAGKNHYIMEDGKWTVVEEDADGYTGGSWGTK